jgi:hypothetical protein
MDRTAVQQLLVKTADRHREERGDAVKLNRNDSGWPAIRRRGIVQHDYPRGGGRAPVQLTALRFPFSYPWW